MNFINFTKINNKNLFLIIGWIIIWSSIGVTPDFIANFKFSLSLNLFNFFRGIFPILYFILLIFYFFFKKKKNIYLKKNPIIILSILYFIMQIIPLFTTKSQYIDIYYLILSTTTLLIIFLKIYSGYKKDDNIFIFISVLFIFLLFLNFSYPQIINFLHTPLSFYQQWGIAAEKKTFLENFNLNYTYPNILGFSRYVLILLLFIYFFKKKYNLICNIIIAILGSLLFLLQARATLLTYLLFVFFHPFIFKQISILNYIKKLFLFLFVPIVIFYSFNLLKKNFFFKQYIEIRNEGELMIFKDKGLIVIRPENKGNFTSDRIFDWKQMLNGNKKVFWGLGPQADRNYYKKTASNGLVYSFICGGYFGFTFFLILCFYSVHICIKYLLIFRDFPLNPNKLFYPMICLMFLIRSIFETSFAVFGIDFIFFFYCVLMVQKFVKNKY